MKFASNMKVILWVTVVCITLISVGYAQVLPGTGGYRCTRAAHTYGWRVTTGATDPPVGVPALAWAAMDGATKYNIQVSLSAGFASPVVDVTTYGLSFTPLTALADSEYFWRVAPSATRSGVRSPIRAPLPRTGALAARWCPSFSHRQMAQHAPLLGQPILVGNQCLAPPRIYSKSAETLTSRP